MHQLFKMLELKNRLFKSSHFYTNYGFILGNFVRGITAFQGYCLNDFQGNLLSLFSCSVNSNWNPIIKLKYFLPV